MKRLAVWLALAGLAWASPTGHLHARANGGYIYNGSLCYDRIAICDVANTLLSNVPHAPDKDFNYLATLYRSGKSLYVVVLQREGERQHKRCFWSSDGGRKWQDGAVLPADATEMEHLGS